MNRREAIAAIAALFPAAALTSIGSNVGSTPTVKPVAAGGDKGYRFARVSKKDFFETTHMAGVLGLLCRQGIDTSKPYDLRFDSITMHYIATQEVA